MVVDHKAEGRQATSGRWSKAGRQAKVDKPQGGMVMTIVGTMVVDNGGRPQGGRTERRKATGDRPTRATGDKDDRPTRVRTTGDKG